MYGMKWKETHFCALISFRFFICNPTPLRFGLKLSHKRQMLTPESELFCDWMKPRGHLTWHFLFPFKCFQGTVAILMQSTSNYIFEVELRETNARLNPVATEWRRGALLQRADFIYGYFLSWFLQNCPLQVFHHSSALSTKKPKASDGLNCISLCGLSTPCCPHQSAHGWHHKNCWVIRYLQLKQTITKAFQWWNLLYMITF